MFWNLKRIRSSFSKLKCGILPLQLEILKSKMKHIFFLIVQIILNRDVPLLSLKLNSIEFPRFL